MTELRYHPARLAPLRAAAAAALHHLLATRSADPAAASALRITAAVRADLEQGWLPAIDRLLSSDAMLTWSTGGPWANGLTADPLGLELAARAGELGATSSDRAVAELTAALLAAADDGSVMATFFTTLGPDVLLALLTSLTTVDHRSIDLPHVLRSGLARAAADGGLPDGFGRGLVRAAVDQHRRLGRTGDAGLALSFLAHGDELPGVVLLEAVDELVVQERRFAAEQGLDVASGWTLWLRDGWPGALGLRSDFAEPFAGGDLDWRTGQDPMYALLGQLARDGGAGRDVFTDPERARYLFGQRDVLADGGRAIVTAAAAAAAGPDVAPTAPGRVLADASLVASAFVNHFGRASARTVGRDDTVSVATARIVGTHLYGVEHAVAWASAATDDDRARRLPARSRAVLTADGLLSDDGRLVADPPIAVGDLSHPVFDGRRTSAIFEPTALGHVLDLAARTDAGVAVVRADLATYQRGVAAAAAGRVAAGGVARSRTGAFLAEAMQDAARLEGRFVRHVGHEAERRGHGRDRVRSFWIGAIGDGLKRAGGLFGPTGSAVVATAAEPATDLARDHLVDAGERAAHDGATMAALASEQLAYVWFRELHDAGVVHAELPAGLVTSGDLPAYGELTATLLADGSGRPSSGWSVSTVLQELDDGAGDVDIDGRAIVDAMTVAQLDPYRTLAD